MKKTVICSIPMRENVPKNIHLSDDLSLPVSDQPYIYPIISFLSRTVEDVDDLKVILLVKKDGNEYYKRHLDAFKAEMSEVVDSSKKSVEYTIIDTEFSQDKEVHEQLMSMLVDEIDVGSHVMVDITFGSKDIPIVVFSALGFAERFLDCSIDNIVYGKAEFRDNQVVSSVICDMIPLYSLVSLTNSIKCDDPDEAKKMLEVLISH